MKYDDELFGHVGERFKALGEPARLRILDALRSGPQSVGELVGTTGLNQANASKHLQLLHRLGFILRSRQGLFVRYSLADGDVFRLCDLMCGRIARQAGRAALPGRLPRGRRARAAQPLSRRRPGIRQP